MTGLNDRSITAERQVIRVEKYWSVLKKMDIVQWDYRDTGGRLHTGITESVELARKAVMINLFPSREVPKGIEYHQAGKVLARRRFRMTKEERKIHEGDM